MNDTAEALPARRQPSLGPPGSPGKDGAAAPPPQPPATLHLTLASLRLPSATADCFLVLKCGPHWGRTGALTPAGAVRDTVSVDWEVSTAARRWLAALGCDQHPLGRICALPHSMT